MTWPLCGLPNDLSGLEVEEVARERRYAGLPKGHRLARKAQVSIMDLKDEPIMWTRRAARLWVDWWAVNPRPDGSEPIWGPENENVDEMLEQVAEAGAICITPRSMATHYARPDLAWVPIADIEPLRIAEQHCSKGARPARPRRGAGSRESPRDHRSR